MNVPTNLSSTTHRSLAIQRGIDLNRAGLHIPHNMMDRICASHIDDSDIAAARNLLNKGGPTPEGLGAMISGAAVPIVVSTALARPSLYPPSSISRRATN